MIKKKKKDSSKETWPDSRTSKSKVRGGKKKENKETESKGQKEREWRRRAEDPLIFLLSLPVSCNEERHEKK